MPLEVPQDLAGGKVPNPEFSTLSAGDKQKAVRGEGGTTMNKVVRTAGSRTFVGSRVPHSNRAILAGRNRQPAVGKRRERAHRTLVVREHRHRISALAIKAPYADGSVAPP